MQKYIHLVWFGGKPYTKLTKKCIKSWEKYLPDFEIIEWNENNVDLNECPFIKEAYENKKWAFVADYVRTKAIYEMGGIYLDTDIVGPSGSEGKSGRAEFSDGTYLDFSKGFLTGGHTAEGGDF